MHRETDLEESYVDSGDVIVGMTGHNFFLRRMLMPCEL